MGEIRSINKENLPKNDSTQEKKIEVKKNHLKTKRNILIYYILFLHGLAIIAFVLGCRYAKKLKEEIILGVSSKEELIGDSIEARNNMTSILIGKLNMSRLLGGSNKSCYELGEHVNELKNTLRTSINQINNKNRRLKLLVEKYQKDLNNYKSAQTTARLESGEKRGRGIKRRGELDEKEKNGIQPFGNSTNAEDFEKLMKKHPIRENKPRVRGSDGLSIGSSGGSLGSLGLIKGIKDINGFSGLSSNEDAFSENLKLRDYNSSSQSLQSATIELSEEDLYPRYKQRKKSGILFSSSDDLVSKSETDKGSSGNQTEHFTENLSELRKPNQGYKENELYKDEGSGEIQSGKNLTTRILDNSLRLDLGDKTSYKDSEFDLTSKREGFSPADDELSSKKKNFKT